MANDADWVADVRRWYFSSAHQPSAATVEDTEIDALGYEAAQPALEARQWPETRAGGVDFK